MKVFSILFVCLFSVSNANKTLFDGGEQEWGYVTVREYAHMFWWLYYTTADVEKNYYEKPLVIWLQGGPGQSSTGYGNFLELGPLDLNFKPRNHTWIKNYNVLFIDSPVGTGFSYIENDYFFQRYSKSNAQIAADLLKCMTEFYNKFPKFSDTPTYVVTESYGGKMTVEFANVWYKEQIKGTIKSNLKGVALGSPWISPLHSVMEYAQSLLYTGMIDSSGYDRIKKGSLSIKEACEEENWTEATRRFAQADSIIFNETDKIDLFNVMTKLKSTGSNGDDNFESVYGDYPDSVNRLAYLMNTVVKQALNLDVSWGSTDGVVYDMLKEDFMKPVTDIVETLLNETDIRVYVFNGQFDLAVNSVGTLKWIEELRWKNAEDWKLAKRQPMIFDGVIEGYVKEYDQLKMFWISRAGHMAAADNPAAMHAVLRDLIDNS